MTEDIGYYTCKHCGARVVQISDFEYICPNMDCTSNREGTKNVRA